MNDLQERQIAAAQELSKLEGMGRSLNVLRKNVFKSGYISYDFSTREYSVRVKEVFRNSEDGLIDSGVIESFLPWMHIDDSSEWSSAKILARAGWDASKTTLYKWLEAKEPDHCLPFELYVELADGNHELAYILAIILLQKIDNEAYLKAMQPLIEG